MTSHPFEDKRGESVWSSCMTRQEQYRATMARRQIRVDRLRLLAAAIIGSIAIIPFGIAGLFAIVRFAWSKFGSAVVKQE